MAGWLLLQEGVGVEGRGLKRSASTAVERVNGATDEVQSRGLQKWITRLTHNSL